MPILKMLGFLTFFLGWQVGFRRAHDNNHEQLNSLSATSFSSEIKYTKSTFTKQLENYFEHKENFYHKFNIDFFNLRGLSNVK